MFGRLRKEPKLIMTSTGELFMPVRIYYKIQHKKSLIKALNRLKCVMFSEEDENHFIISYHKEAKKLNLSTHYQDVPKGLYPVSLAEGYITYNSELFIDTKSLGRAVELIDFLERVINIAGIIEITAIANVNKVTSAKTEDEFYKCFDIDYGKLFNNIVITDYNRMLFESMPEVFENDKDVEERIKELDKKIQELKQQEIDHYPDVEKIALRYSKSNHREIISMLSFRALIKEIVARRRYDGDKKFTSFDAIHELEEFIDETTPETSFH